MEMKYKTLLVDDSKAVCFFNKIVIDRSNLFSEVKISENGQEAIDILKKGFSPDIIFLDINMPVMDGWEFLEEYTQTKIHMSPVVLLLGATLNEENRDRLSRYSIVKDVRGKMLSSERLNEILNSVIEV